jgi:invasion protein IalB
MNGLPPVSNGTSNTLPWVIAVVATALGAGALGYFAGNYTAPAPAAVPVATAPGAPAAPAPLAPGELPAGVTSETFGAWTVFCQDTPEGKKNCSVTQDIKNPQDTAKVILSVIAGYNELAQRAFLVLTPLGSNLSAGLEFNLPGDKPVAFEFGACDPTSCNALLSVPDDKWPTMEAAGSFELAYTRADGVRVPVTIQLNGFSEAFAKLDKPAPVPAPAEAAPAAAAPEAPATPAAPPAEPAPEGTPEPTPKPAQP